MDKLEKAFAAIGCLLAGLGSITGAFIAIVQCLVVANAIKPLTNLYAPVWGLSAFGIIMQGIAIIVVFSILGAGLIGLGRLLRK